MIIFQKINLVRFTLAALLAVFSPQRSYAEDSRFQYPQQYSLSPKGVNVQTGRFMSSKADLSIGNMTLTRNWGDVPSMAINRSIGASAVYSEDVVQGWVTPNVGWNHSFNQGVSYWTGSNTALPRAYVVVDGKQYTFAVLTDGTIGPADQGSQGTRLVSASGQWSFTDRAGNLFTFFAHPAIAQGGVAGNPVQVLQSAVYANGTRIDYAYNGAAQPRFVKSNTGYAIAFDYDGNGNVAAACGFNLAQTFADASTTCAGATLKVAYGYDATGRNLTSVTDTLGRVVTITYVTPLPGYSFPSCVSFPNVATCEIQNSYGFQPGDALATYSDQVRVQTTATGDVWRYSYIPQPDPIDVPIVAGLPRYSRATITDPVLQPTALKYDRGHLVTQTTPAGAVNYRYAYRKLDVPYVTGNPTTLQYHDAMPRLVIQPEGDIQYIGHDNRGNLTQNSFWPKGAVNPLAPTDPNLVGCCVSPDPPVFPAGSVTYGQTFLGDEGFTSNFGAVFVLGCGSGPPDAKLCDKPLTRTDPNGNVTDYTYDVAHGGILTETRPAVNGIRPQTRYTYAQRFAWIKNSSGTFVQTSSPVWVLISKSICKTGAASGAGCAVAGDEVRTTFDYGPNSGPNNLLLRGMVDDATGLALRTCYSYDGQGNKISETKPRAGLTSCP